MATVRGTFVLVGCGAAKQDINEAVEARDLYTSTYFALKRRYAEAATQWAGDHQHCAWAILSAEHGVIPPRHEITPYDTTVTDLSPASLDDWVRRVTSGLASWLNWPFQSGNDPRDSPCGELIVLAGQSYLDPLREGGAFKGLKYGLPAPPQFPFEQEGLGGIGEQMAWLKTEAERLETEAAPAEQDGLGSVGGGYQRTRPRWHLDRPGFPDEHSQADLFAFEDTDRYLATVQERLPTSTDGGERP